MKKLFQKKSVRIISALAVILTFATVAWALNRHANEVINGIWHFKAPVKFGASNGLKYTFPTSRTAGFFQDNGSGTVSISPNTTYLNFTATELTASGAIASNVTYVELNSTTPLIAATIAAPSAGRLLVITQTDAGTAGHTVTLTAGTYNGTNTIATFNAAAETLVLFGVSATRFVIVENIGSVALSGT